MTDTIGHSIKSMGTSNMRLVAALMALFGLPGGSSREVGLQRPGPGQIFFTVPTLSDDIAETQPLSAPPVATDLVFHEDDWCQVEFLPGTQLENVKRTLQDLKRFELANRDPGGGWREVYLRKLQRVPLVPGETPLRTLEATLGTKAGPGPVLTAGGEIQGRVKQGFTLPLGGKIGLYGFMSGPDLPVLGASVGQGADPTFLTRAFLKLSAKHGLILVDWRAQLVLISADEATGRVEVWRP